MRNHVFVRPARPQDSETFLEWSLKTKDNLFDPEAAKNQSSYTLCAYDKDGPIAFVPVQRPMVMEALAIRPGADPVEVAVALKELTQALVTLAHQNGVGEILFLCTEPTTERFAERQAFEKLPWNLYRLRLSDLEK